MMMGSTGEAAVVVGVSAHEVGTFTVDFAVVLAVVGRVVMTGAGGLVGAAVAAAETALRFAFTFVVSPSVTVTIFPHSSYPVFLKMILWDPAITSSTVLGVVPLAMPSMKIEAPEGDDAKSILPTSLVVTV